MTETKENVPTMKIIKVKHIDDIPTDFTGIVEWIHGSKHWYLNGKIHREDGPAVEGAYGVNVYWLNGQSFIDENKWKIELEKLRVERTKENQTKETSEMKKEEVPTMQTIKVKTSYKIPKNFTGILEYEDGTKIWHLNGEYHREDGPACEFANGDKRWFLNAERFLSEENWKIEVEKLQKNQTKEVPAMQTKSEISVSEFSTLESVIVRAASFALEGDVDGPWDISIEMSSNISLIARSKSKGKFLHLCGFVSNVNNSLFDNLLGLAEETAKWLETEIMRRIISGKEDVINTIFSKIRLMCPENVSVLDKRSVVECLENISNFVYDQAIPLAIKAHTTDRLDDCRKNVSNLKTLIEEFKK